MVWRGSGAGSVVEHGHVSESRCGWNVDGMLVVLSVGVQAKASRPVGIFALCGRLNCILLYWIVMFSVVFGYEVRLVRLG